MAIFTDRKPKAGRDTPGIALAVSTAIATMALAGCTTGSAPAAEASFASAQAALGKGQASRAVAHAEAAVLAEPRNPGYRALLGAAYLETGRFEAAATSFGDALDLGDEDPRTVLSFALAKIALGDNRAAAAVLGEYERVIDPADFGLALALAGQPERGTHVLINAVRASTEATPKLRQNLAYAYALAGNWRAARVMAAEDVPADQLEARLADWAVMVAPGNHNARIASLLGVTPVADSGQPAHLALANFPAQDVLVAEAAAQGGFAATPAPSGDFAAAFDAPAAKPAPALASAPAERIDPSAEARPTAATGLRFVSNPVVQELPARTAAPRVQQRRMAATAAAAAPAPVAAPAAPVAKGDSHLVQLGAYNSKAEAQRGWDMLKGKFPQLKDHDVVITEAVVGGRTFWRVAAAGFGAMSAKAMCGTVKSAGRGCFAYAAASPPKGAVDRGVRVAARTR